MMKYRSWERRSLSQRWRLVLLGCLALALGAQLVGCGGGGGKSPGSPPGGGGGGGGGEPADAQIRGQVAGTLIVAVNEAGNAYLTKADPDGSFLLAFPSQHDYRFYLLEDGIFPLFSGNDNIFRVPGPVVIQVGALTPQDGRAVAQTPPEATDTVERRGQDTSLPGFFLEPATAGLSTEEILDLGFDALETGTYVLARGYFKQAVEQVGTETSNTADTARFFHALTRVAALFAMVQSDGQEDGLNDLGDFLDAAGFDPTRRANTDALIPPDTFPGTTPTGEDFRQFLATQARAELEGALQDLDGVSGSFVRQWSFLNPAAETRLTPVESDFGDVLFFRSVFHGLLSGFLSLASYDLGGDAARHLNDPNVSLQSVVAANPDGMTHRDTTLLPAARAAASSAIDDMTAAIQFMRQESDPQNDDLINLVDESPQGVDDFLADLAAYKDNLTNPRVLQQNDGSSGTLNAANFFDADGLSLRPFSPPFDGNQAAGLFQGQPFGDVYLGYSGGTKADPNHDANQDGISDILQPNVWR